MYDHANRPIKLIIQIPCLNEESTLPTTLADLPRYIPGIDVVEWLVVDDGSSDETAAVARELGVDHIVRHRRNRGLAAAFMSGIEAALDAGADIIVNTDADNQYDASCLPDLVAPLLAGEADIVVGERPIESIPEFSGVKKRLQRLGSNVVSGFAGTKVPDATSGFRAFTRDAASRLQVFSRYTYTLETLVQAGHEGLAVRSVPVTVNAQTRESRLVKTTSRYVLSSAHTIVRSFALYRPFRFFTLLGSAPFLMGVALLARWLLLRATDDGYPSRLPSLIVASILIVVAVQVWIFAFIADIQAASRRMQADARLRQRRGQLASTTADDGPLTASTTPRVKRR